MTSVTSSASPQQLIRAAAFGVLFALVFALICRLLPGDLFANDGWLVLAMVIGAAAGPPTVWSVHGVAGTTAAPALEAGVIGAMTFDGLALGFAPTIYGQSGDALVGLAATLVIAFMAVLAAGCLARSR